MILCAVKTVIERGVCLAGKNGGNTAEAVRSLVKPYVDELNLMLWDVRFVKEGANWYLRVFIDSENGITIEDCEAVSRAIDEPLDEADLIAQSYCLEVCSPGIERELVRTEHFERFEGADIMVKMIRPLDALGKEFKGVLINSDKAAFTINADGKEVVINKKDAVWVKLDDFEM